MSQNLKDILKNGEEQFNPQAWENLAQRLDHVLPVKKTNIFSPKALLIMGASALFIGSGIFFFAYQGKGTAAKAQKNLEAQKELSNKEIAEEKILSTDNTSTYNSKISQKEETKSNATGILEEKQTNKNYSEQSDLNEENGNLENSQNYADKISDQVNKNSSENLLIPFKTPKLEGIYCLNGQVTIENKNFSKCFLLNENKILVATINGKATAKVILKNTGSYYLEYPLYDNNIGENKMDEFFQVKESKRPEFSVDNEVLFDNGVPYITLSASDFQNGMSWSTNKGEIKEQSDKTKLTVFRKGIYTVSLEKTDENKCKLSKTQQIEIKEDYNLLAPTAFDPSDLDPRNNRFIPFALTKRSVLFDLIILDPESGKIVFQSNSPENAWDGIDKNTGQLVKSSKAFIWKVSLKNPEIGEKPEYAGTITIVRN